MSDQKLQTSAVSNNTECIEITHNNNSKRGPSTESLKLVSTGDFDSFRCFVEENSCLNGKWKSPSDERKSYSDGNTTITCWKYKKHISKSKA